MQSTMADKAPPGGIGTSEEQDEQVAPATRTGQGLRSLRLAERLLQEMLLGSEAGLS